VNYVFFPFNDWQILILCIDLISLGKKVNHDHAAAGILKQQIKYPNK
jgi:hypothetical protein